MEDLPDLMTAAVTIGHGGPEMIEIRQDWPLPRPAAGEALVRVTAAGVNNTDIWTREGGYGSDGDADSAAGWQGSPLGFPRIQGGDITGFVADVGPGVTEDLIGRRVLVDPAVEYDEFDHPTKIVGSELDGGFAQFHVSAVDRIHDVSTSPLSDQQLACLPIAYGTALGMIYAADCGPEERVLVTGASGGVGLAATQILSSRGCHVVAYTSAAKVDAIRDSGASEVVVRGRDRLSEVEETDVVFDVVGGEEFGAVVDCLRTGGRLVMAGAIAGPWYDSTSGVCTCATDASSGRRCTPRGSSPKSSNWYDGAKCLPSWPTPIRSNRSDWPRSDSSGRTSSENSY